MSLPPSCSISLMGTSYFDDDKTVHEEETTEKSAKTISFSTDTESKTPAQLKKEQLEKVFGELFSKYNYVSYDILATLSQITKETFTDRVLEDYDDTKIGNLLVLVEKAFSENYDESTKTLNLDNAIEKAKQYHTAGSVEAFNDKSKVQTIDDILKSDKDSGLSDEKKVLNYFENKLAEYKAEFNGDENKAKEELIKDFNRILAHTTSDADKKILLPVLLTVLKDVATVQNFFSTIKDSAIKTECADSVTDTLKTLNPLDEVDADIIYEVCTHMSKDKVFEYLNTIDNEFQELYNTEKETIESILRKEKTGEELTPHEQEVNQKLCKSKLVKAILTVAVQSNENFTEEDKEEFNKRVIEFERQYPTYEFYLETLAQFVNDNKMSLNLGEEKLEQLRQNLDKATDGEYSKAAERVAEKNSAIDSQTGLLKQKTNSDVIKEKESAIKKQLALQYEASETEDNGYAIEGLTSADTSTKALATSVLPKTNDTAQMFAIVKNTVDDVTNDMIKKAVKTYKNSGLGDKIKVLTIATGKMFEAVKKDKDVNAFSAFIKSGNKCRTNYQTKQIEEIVKEADDDRKSKAS